MVENNDSIYGTTRVIAYTLPLEKKNYLFFTRTLEDDTIKKTYINQYSNTQGQLALRDMTVDSSGMTYCLLSGGGSNHQQLVCFDELGDIHFRTRFTQNGYSPNWFNMLITCKEGIYVFFSVKNKFSVFKFSNFGDLLWAKDYSFNDEMSYSSGSIACYNASNGLFVAGTGKFKHHCLSIAENGEIEWDHTIQTEFSMRPHNVFIDDLGYFHIHGIRNQALDSKPYYLKYNLLGELIQSDYYTIQSEYNGLDFKRNPNGNGYFMFINTSFGSVIIFLDDLMNPYLCKTYEQQLNLYGTLMTRLKTNLNSFVINNDYNGSVSFNLSEISSDICPSTLNFIPVRKADLTLLDTNSHLLNQFVSLPLSTSVEFGVSWFLTNTSTVKTTSFCYNKDFLNIENLNGNIYIYPNPCVDKVRISGLNVYEIISISIFDQMGKELEKSKYTLVNDQLFFKDFENGIYTMKILSKHGVFMSQVIMMR